MIEIFYFNGFYKALDFITICDHMSLNKPFYPFCRTRRNKKGEKELHSN